MNKLHKESKIFIAGHMGMVGSACWRLFKRLGYKNLIGKTSGELDLRNQLAVKNFLANNKPDVIIDCAARVGGIIANNVYPYEFLMDNMLIQNNLIKTSHELDVKKFIFLGSSCIYPKFAPQPIKEEYLLTDTLEPTNEWYALAKITGIKLISALEKQYGRDYKALMPTNLYGPGDNYNLETSHVIPAMIRKFYEAKLNNNSDVILWGTGKPLREFLHVDDLAKAIFFSSNNKLPETIYNVGSENEISIKELAILIQSKVNHSGKINWDNSKPDGTPRKLLDSSRLKNLGFKANITLEYGLSKIIKNIENEITFRMW